MRLIICVYIREDMYFLRFLLDLFSRYVKLARLCCAEGRRREVEYICLGNLLAHIPFGSPNPHLDIWGPCAQTQPLEKRLP